MDVNGEMSFLEDDQIQIEEAVAVGQENLVEVVVKDTEESYEARKEAP